MAPRDSLTPWECKGLIFTCYAIGETAETSCQEPLSQHPQEDTEARSPREELAGGPQVCDIPRPASQEPTESHARPGVSADTTQDDGESPELSNHAIAVARDKLIRDDEHATLRPDDLEARHKHTEASNQDRPTVHRISGTSVRVDWSGSVPPRCRGYKLTMASHESNHEAPRYVSITTLLDTECTSMLVEGLEPAGGYSFQVFTAPTLSHL